MRTVVVVENEVFTQVGIELLGARMPVPSRRGLLEECRFGNRVVVLRGCVGNGVS